MHLQSLIQIKKYSVFSSKSWIVYQKDILLTTPSNRTGINHAWLLHNEHMSEKLLEKLSHKVFWTNYAEIVTTQNIAYFYSSGCYVDRAELMIPYKHTYMNNFNLNFPLISVQVS